LPIFEKGGKKVKPGEGKTWRGLLSPGKKKKKKNRLNHPLVKPWMKKRGEMALVTVLSLWGC